MNEYKISDYGIFNDAISTTNKVNESLTNNQTTINDCSTNLNNESVFMGPICDEAVNAFSEVSVKLNELTENFSTISTFINETAESYKAGDVAATKEVTGDKEKLNTSLSNESTANKSIDLNNIDKNSKVGKAVSKYSDELKNADYATVNDSIYTTTTTTTINGKEVEVTHVVINNGSQINGAPANGSYGNGLENAKSASKRLNSKILINGSHFDYGTGKEDLKGANNIVIVNGEVKQNGTSGGNELLLNKDGRIYNAYGKTADQLVNEGVKYSFSCHSTQVIENGDTSPSYRETKAYKRNVIGMTQPGEYYIVTDKTENNNLSDTAEYLKSKGCTNAYSMDQGGSVSLVRNNDVINNPTGNGEDGLRSVGDFLYFT